MRCNVQIECNIQIFITYISYQANRIIQTEKCSHKISEVEIYCISNQNTTFTLRTKLKPKFSNKRFFEQTLERWKNVISFQFCYYFSISYYNVKICYNFFYKALTFFILFHDTMTNIHIRHKQINFFKI